MPLEQYKKGPAGPDQLPQGGAQQLNQQLAQSEQLRDSQQPVINQLQNDYSDGKITLSQYNKAINDLWNARAAQQATNLAAQGKEGMAAGIAGTIGPNGAPATAQGVSPFSGPTDLANRSPEGVDLGGGPQALPKLDPNSDEGLLLGPTLRPHESVTTGAGSFTGRVAPPPNVYDMLPTLAQAARAPDAPPQLRTLLELILTNLGIGS